MTETSKRDGPSSQDVAKRVLALFAVASAAHIQPPTSVRKWLADRNLKEVLSANEREFMSLDSAPHASIEAASWRVESILVLMWALKRVATLPPADTQTTWEAAGIGRDLKDDPMGFIGRSELRSADELNNMGEEIASQHWGVRAGPAGRELFNHPKSEGLIDPRIIQERHYAINWLLGYGSDWDAVPTDT